MLNIAKRKAYMHEYNQRYGKANYIRKRELSLEYYYRNRERIKPKMRAAQLKRQYGLTIDSYNAMFASQNGLCLGCYRHQSTLKSVLYVDHDHISCKVRGLLCQACNTVLGRSFDKSETLRRLADYLDKHNAKSN